MKPVWFAVLAVLLYASFNLILKRKLADISPFAFIAMVYSIPLIAGWLVVAYQRTANVPLVVPQSSQWPAIVIAGLIVIAADYCFFSAYHSGGSIATVATIAALFPAAATFINSLTGGGRPTMPQVIGMALAAISAALVSKE